MSKNTFSDVAEEQLAVVEFAIQRLIRSLKNTPNLTGPALKRMKLVEQAVQCIECARLT